MLRVYLVWKDTNKKEMSAKIEEKIQEIERRDVSLM